ncbi:MAG: nucleotide exchange factor GrpE [Candidatus Thorarchaeota archaeon]
MKITLFEDYFDKFMNEGGFNRGSFNKISISKEEYDRLLDLAEKYELLATEHKQIKSRNDALLKELDDLKEDARKFKQLEEEKEKFLNSLLRVQADFENYKKMSERENQRYKSYVKENILKKLVQHHDDLIRALNMLEIIENGESIKKGFELLIKNFEKLLKEEGVEALNCEGEKFDPYKHEALMTEERNDIPENTIIEELDKGYYLNNKILRPAKVKISKKPKSNLENLKEKKNE